MAKFGFADVADREFLHRSTPVIGIQPKDVGVPIMAMDFPVQFKDVTLSVGDKRRIAIGLEDFALL